MSLSVVFWMIMILSFLFGMWSSWPAPGVNPVKPLGTTFLIFVLLAILGWAQFGAAIHR
jgi:hypothetical protein